jgi:hypothetical protein
MSRYPGRDSRGRRFDGCDVKQLAFIVPLVLGLGPAFGAEAGSGKAECDAVLTAEVKRLEEGFSRTRVAWEQTVEQRFQDHTQELTTAQMDNARATFNDLVMKLSNEHVKAVALPGIYRMMLAVPRYDVGVCSKPGEMRSIGDQAIAGFLLKLTELLPLVEKTVLAAKSDS